MVIEIVKAGSIGKLNMSDAVNRLRILAIVEGTSLLLLFFVAMPLKYVYGNTMSVPVMGWVHGVLFILFMFYATLVSLKKNWSDRFLLLLVISSMVPFGMVLMDRKLKSMHLVAAPIK